MSIIKDIIELKNDKNLALILLICAIILLSPSLLLFVIYYPELIFKLDIFKLLLLATTIGTISITPTTVVFLYIDSTIKSRSEDSKEVLLVAALIGGFIFVIPFQILLLIIAYFIYIPIKLFIILNLITIILLPILVIVSVLLERRKKLKNKPLTSKVT